MNSHAQNVAKPAAKQPPALSIALGQYSTAGAKAENQDFHGTIQPKGADLASKGIACAIADGISTSSRGAEAAEITVKNFLTDYYCTPDGWTARRCGECVIAACNSWMYSTNMRQRPREEGISREAVGLICTLSAVVIKGRAAHIFHVGDGQVLHIAAGGAQVLTTAHRVSLGGGKSYLGRAMGANSHVEIEYIQTRVQVGDLLVLSTDGVHEQLSPSEYAPLIAGEDSLDQAARAIADEAARRGSIDNLTVQVVRIESLPRGEMEDLLGREADLPPPPPLGVGDVFENYAILDQLHTGARSHVYLANDLSADVLVALKVPSTERAGDPAANAALLFEDWVMRRLDHPNLLPAAPARASRGYAYSAAQYIAGTSLHRWMLSHPAGDLGFTRKVIGQISTGLEALHRRSMLHRDLRPHNVILTDDNTAVIVDFGSVRVAGVDEVAPPAFEDSAFAGTLQYSAPELFLGQAASERSDVFSLGVIAYQMLTGELPYGALVAGAKTRAAQRKLIYTPATRYKPDIPEWMDAALARALAVDPRDRYAAPAMLVGDLANPNRDLTRASSRPLWSRGSSGMWRLIAALLAAALIVSIITRPDITLQTTQPKENRP